MSSATPSAARPTPDAVLADIADYVANYRIESEEAYTTAQYCLIDTLGCARGAAELRSAA